jgi:hypothetical protein
MPTLMSTEQERFYREAMLLECISRCRRKLPSCLWIETGPERISMFARAAPTSLLVSTLSEEMLSSHWENILIESLIWNTGDSG